MANDRASTPDPLSLLVREHDVIQRGLWTLQSACILLERGTTLPQGFQPWIVEFFREYADRCHHAKEEFALLPWLAPRADDALRALMADLEREHVTFRAYVGELERLDLREGEGRKRFAAVARRYVDELRQHIYRENNDVLAPVSRTISRHERAGLSAAFDRAERETGTRDLRDRYLAGLRGWEGRLADATRALEASRAGEPDDGAAPTPPV